MRRLKVVFRPEALADLAEIFRYVLWMSGSQATAQGFVKRIQERCHRIGNVPYGGVGRDDLEPRLRTVPFERRAVIAYRIASDAVETTNVFYGGRDFEALYRGREPDEGDASGE
jgi:toxin ParE1/3/4